MRAKRTQAPERPPERPRPFPFLAVLAIAVGIHVVAIAATSPSLFGREDTSPDALMEKAQALVDQEQYQAAMEVYQRVLQQKPDVPPVFAQAEQLMQQARIKALEKQRRLEEEQKANEEAGTAEESKTAPEGEAAGPAEQVQPPDLPPIDLPELPPIE